MLRRFLIYFMCFSLCLTSPTLSWSQAANQNTKKSQSNEISNFNSTNPEDRFNALEALDNIDSYFQTRNQNSKQDQSLKQAQKPASARIESNLDSYLEPIKLELGISTTALDESILELDQEAVRHYQTACCAGVPGVEGHTDLESLSAITQQYQLIKADVEGYLNKTFNREDLAEYLRYNSGWLNAVSFDDIYTHLNNHIHTRKLILITTMLSMASKVILAQMYLGKTLNTMDFSPFNLFISNAGFKSITDSIHIRRERSGILLIQPTSYGQQNGVYIKLDPSSFADAQLFIETSQNSDAALTQLIFYPILESYYASILEIQTLRGITNPSPPDINPLIQNGYFSLSTQEILWEKRHRRITEASFRQALLESFNEVIGIDVEQIAQAFQQAIDNSQFNEISQMEDFLSEHVNADWLHQRLLTDNDPDYFLTNILETLPYLQNQIFHLIVEEFQLLPQFLEFYIREWQTDLYCATFDNCIRSDLRGQLADIAASSKWSIILNRINRATIDAHLSADEKNTQATIDIYLTEDEINARDRALAFIDAAKIDLIERLQRSNLLDEWIEKTLEITSSQRTFQAVHNQYVDTLIESSHHISSSDQGNISTNALYATIKEQDGFQISLETDRLIDSTFRGLINYLATRALFNGLLTDQLRSLTNKDPDDIYYNSDPDKPENAVIDPHKVRVVLRESVPASTIQSPLLQAVHQQTLDSKRKTIEELLLVGQDMGYFNESLTPEKLSGPEAISLLKNDILSQLQEPPRRFWCLFFSCQSQIDWYFDKYTVYRESEIVDQNRILSDRYSQEVPLFEVITENCPLETSVTDQNHQCRDKISPIVLEALAKQEEDIKNNFQALVHDIISDSSDALEKALQAIKPFSSEFLDIDNINLNDVSRLLQREDRYKAQFDFHTERLQDHLTPTFWQRRVNDIDKAANDLIWTFWFTLLPWASRPLGLLAGRAGFSGIQGGIQAFSGVNSQAANIYGRALFPIWGYSLSRGVQDFFQAQSHTNLTEELYYISPTTNALVNNTQLMISEHLGSSSRDSFIIPAILIVSLIASRFLGPGFRNLLTRYNDRVIGSLKERHLPRLRQHPNQFDWNMTRLGEEVKVLQQSSSLSERVKINRSWRAVQRFYNYHKNNYRAEYQINQRMPNITDGTMRGYFDRLRQFNRKGQPSIRDRDQQMMRNLHERLRSEMSSF